MGEGIVSGVDIGVVKGEVTGAEADRGIDGDVDGGNVGVGGVGVEVQWGWRSEG